MTILNKDMQEIKDMETSELVSFHNILQFNLKRHSFNSDRVEAMEKLVAVIKELLNRKGLGITNRAVARKLLLGRGACLLRVK